MLVSSVTCLDLLLAQCVQRVRFRMLQRVAAQIVLRDSFKAPLAAPLVPRAQLEASWISTVPPLATRAQLVHSHSRQALSHALFVDPERLVPLQGLVHVRHVSQARLLPTSILSCAPLVKPARLLIPQGPFLATIAHLGTTLTELRLLVVMIAQQVPTAAFTKPPLAHFVQLVPSTTKLQAPAV